MAFLQAWWAAFWGLIFESGLWLMIGFAMAGAMHAIVPRGFLERHLAGRGPWPIFKASLLGIPLPLCSCSVIPVAAGLRRGGASRGASAAFAISTPQTGEESIPLTWALFGPVYAFVRPVVAVLTAFIAGMLIELTSSRDRVAEASKPDTALPIAGCCSSQPEAPSCGCATPKEEPVTSSCCSSTSAAAPRTWGERIRAGLRHGFVTMPLDLAVWLTIGFVLAALITAIVPTGWIESNIGTGLVPMLLMLLVGIPLYICATSSTPLAYTLVLAGLSPGAALVLLLAGPATNLATITWAIKDLGVRATVIYLIVIAVVAVLAGWAFDAFLSSFVHLSEAGAMAEHEQVGWLFAGGAIAFSVLLGWSLTIKVIELFSRETAACARGACETEPPKSDCCSH